MAKVLFICKQGQGYSKSAHRRLSGLYNSTIFVASALPDAVVVEVIDNNCINRVVTEHKPKIVVIEALWVVPEKFDVLRKLHPDVMWHIHLHSNMPFLANEGMAMEWIRGYVHRNLGIIVNSVEAFEGMEAYLHRNIVCLPNIYPARKEKRAFQAHDHQLHVGCFGAIRPMKNHLTQALAALKFAREHNKYLYFHINSTRVEGNGENILKNLRAMFKHEHHSQLVEHSWMEHEDFLKVLRTIDIGMQVSLSETFNIVTADMVSCGIPVVTSPEVRWVSGLSHADPASVDDIADRMGRVWKSSFITWINQAHLAKHSRRATAQWRSYIEEMCED